MIIAHKKSPRHSAPPSGNTHICSCAIVWSYSEICLVSAVFYGNKRELLCSPSASAAPTPPRKITREEFLSYARDNNLVITELSQLVDRLRQNICSRLLLPNLRDLYQEPAFTLQNFPEEVLRSLCEGFLGEPGFTLSMLSGGGLKLDVWSLRLLHKMLDLRQVSSLYEGGVKFVKPAKVKRVRALLSVCLPFILVARRDDIKVSFKYVLVDEEGGITPPKEVAWTDLDERRSRIVILEQMKVAMARAKARPRLSAKLRRQVEPEYVSDEEEVEEEAEEEEEEEEQQQQQRPPTPPPAPREL